MPIATSRDVTPATARPGAPRRTARREATRQRLLTAAADVFAERGFHGASVEDICERAEFTRGAFYSNFGSRDELVLELYAQHATRLQAAVGDLAAQPGLTLDELLEGVIRVWTGQPEERRRWHLLISEFALHALRDPAARTAYADLQRALRRDLVALVDQIASAHGLTLTLPTEDTVRMITIVLQGGLGQHLLEPRAVPAGTLEREFLPLLIAAATRPGR
ncbi:TetR/AcrR family transcriptional regulator [Pedococcus bigeumensis]|uniref:TetR/AcrR family transcriptional regulator n=1 Tax=Pedococcus bigeumensis TaxID=433644 RepID=A0A502CWL1_9MICO|nr:TetR/AcrR family transcriptional regulator [Pedococcus bigeumensis]TPG16131.1 TetR/AcrR family transcriptional regulator [Pedococcus bigeumensis]